MSSSPTGVGGSVAGLQIPSMVYPPSSTISHFKLNMILSNISNWLIADSAFFVSDKYYTGLDLRVTYYEFW